MRRVRATTLAAFAHQDLPFEELIESLKREHPSKPAALANVMLVLHNSTLRPMANRAQKLSFEEANATMLAPLVTLTSFDVLLNLRECPDGLVGTCVYKPHLFDAKTIDRLLRDFEEVLERMVARPEQSLSEDLRLAE
jgi:non-ribosomal peptide synthetase component F